MPSENGIKMMVINPDLCNGCGICQKQCPLDAIGIRDGLASVEGACVRCGLCMRVCPSAAVSFPEETVPNAVKCYSCPVQCEIQEGFLGACHRYRNEGSLIVRNRKLVVPCPDSPGAETSAQKLKPLVTAIGAGTTYPCYKPAPLIVYGMQDGIEVVTSVSEAPLSYCNVEVKIDTNFDLGEVGSPVRKDGKKVGLISSRQYGCVFLSLGGVNLIESRYAQPLVKMMVDIINRRPFRINIGDLVLDLNVGKPPVVNGVVPSAKVACGAAIVAAFAKEFQKVADEVLVIDNDISALLTESTAGVSLEMKYSGVIPRAKKFYQGRYFFEPGNGWGGTSVVDPGHAIEAVDMRHGWEGMRVLVIENTGSRYAFFTVTSTGSLVNSDQAGNVAEVAALVAGNSEESRVSALLIGGIGGSARAGITRYPIKLTKAVHEGLVRVTIGGAPVFVYPGGNIIVAVDVEKVMAEEAFSALPLPAVVTPVEYTMDYEFYKSIGGHVDSVVPFSSVKKRS
jgi:ferredoxin